MKEGNEQLDNKFLQNLLSQQIPEVCNGVEVRVVKVELDHIFVNGIIIYGFGTRAQFPLEHDVHFDEVSLLRFSHQHPKIVFESRNWLLLNSLDGIVKAIQSNILLPFLGWSGCDDCPLAVLLLHPSF